MVILAVAKIMVIMVICWYNCRRWRPLRARPALVRERDCHREPRQLCARSCYDRRHRRRQVDDDDEEDEDEKLALNNTHLNTNQNIDVLNPPCLTHICSKASPRIKCWKFIS